MKHYLLIYDFIDGYIDRRPAFRGEHLRLAWAAAARGELMMGGALSDPADTGLLLFTSTEAAEVFARDDPYVTNDLVKTWRVREWVTVAGPWAANPVQP